MPSRTTDLSSLLTFLARGGEMGERLRAHDWASTPLGAAETWPQSLRTAVRIMLTSRQPIWIGWGADLTYLYNDAYHSIIGGKHPWALGRPTREVWSEIWPDIDPLLQTAMSGVEGTYVEEQLLIMERNGYAEETYYTFSYSPIPDDDGAPGGIICANTADTARVIGDRQLALLREVAATTMDARAWREACERGVEALGAGDRDITFALLYARDAGQDDLSLIASTGIDPGHPARPETLPVDAASPWPMREAFADRAIHVVDHRETCLTPSLPTGAWDRPSQTAAILSVPGKFDAKRDIFLIVGLNPYRLVDEDYRDFLQQLAGQIAGAIASADAYEAERRRSEALAELDKAKTTFFSNVSHEFRTPLTLMLGPLEDLLSSEGLPGGVRGQIEVAHRNGVRLLRLVNSLLDFSRIEAGRVRAAYAPTDLARFTEEIASTFRSAIERAGLTFKVETAAMPGPVYVDREMWEKVILNLLSNAFKFTLEGEITVSLGPSEDGASAVVAVSDTGVGIPQSELPKIFERFHRIENQQGRSFEGSGIGLALVQELVRIQGGQIAVASASGEGATFTITLPLGKGHLPTDLIRDDAGPSGATERALEYVEEALRWGPDAAIAAEAFNAPPSGGVVTAGDRPRVLLADDNADMRDYVERLLSATCEVVAVPDGLEALDRIRRNPPDLVLTDVMMPGMDGFALLEAIRRDERLRDLPVIVISARAGEEARIEGLTAGADDYLTKPFTARELVARVSSNLKLAAIRKESKAAIAKSEERLRELNARLEERVAEEVADRIKAEDALRQSQKMEAVGQLTGGVAHDFNNLLTVIMGGLDTIRRSQPGDEARVSRAVDMALRGAQRAASLTARLLAFARRQPLEPKPIDLNALVRDMTELLHRTLGDDIELEGVLTPRLWAVEVDQNQLENALINLAVNARDAMPGGGKLTIETSNTALDEGYAATDTEVIPGQYVAIAVSDTGHGMSKETLSRVFEPFFTTKAIGQGTGLGLSMIYGFVKQSGGHVTLYSEVGHGTTVKLYFPRHHGDSPAAPVAERLSAPTASAGETVLVVEDNDEVRAYSVMVLAELGYRVLEAANGQDALAIVGTDQRLDLLFSDVMLPGLSGRAVADHAAAMRPGLKTLFTTGYSRNAIVHHGRLDPGVQLISKPFTLEQLAMRVRDILDR